MAGNQGNNKIIWHQWQVDFLINNFDKMNSFQLSEALGIKRTKVRMKYASLGLKKMELQFWTIEQHDLLMSLCKTTGNVEIAEIFTKKWPKKKGWTKNHIAKRMMQWNLSRNNAEKDLINKKNKQNGRFNLEAAHKHHELPADLKQSIKLVNKLHKKIRHAEQNVRP